MSEIMRIRQLVAEKLGVEEQELAEDLRLDVLDWDSLDLLEFAVVLEQEFEIRLVDERMRRCKTIDEVAELITAALRA